MNNNSSSNPSQEEQSFASIRILWRRMREGTFGELLQDWRWIFGYTYRYRMPILLYLVLGLAGTCLGQLSSYLNIDIVNIIVDREGSRLWYLILVSVASMLISLFLTNYIGRLSTKLSIDINNDIQSDIFSGIMDADWMEITSYHPGDLLNRFNGDANTVSSNAIGWIPSLIISLVNFAITLVIMWMIDPTIALLAFAGAPVTLLASRYILKKQRAYGKKVRAMSSELMGFETEAFSNTDTIKSFGIADRYHHALKDWQRKFRGMQLEYNLFSIKTNVFLSILGYLVASACFFYCLYRLWNNVITYGEMTYILTQRAALSSSFSQVLSMIPAFLNSSISAERIRELMELKKELHITESSELDAYADRGIEVSVEHVNYSYKDEDQLVIRDGSVIARPGEIIALIGPSGEGKTTLIRLILGLIHPKEGQVSLRCGDRSVPVNVETRHLFSYVPQGNTILSGTIAENLRMVRPEASDAEMIEALKMACAWDFVRNLPDGIYSVIGERGRGFSEGQSQRIAIARAILRNSPILLLDEATSALDAVTEREVLNNIIKRHPHKTIIVTTHRPSVLSLCQRIYRVMDAQIRQVDELDS